MPEFKIRNIVLLKTLPSKVYLRHI